MIAASRRDLLYCHIMANHMHHKGVKPVGMRGVTGHVHMRGVTGHVHLPVGLSSVMTVALLVNAVTAPFSRWLHETGEGCAKFAWQEGYAAFRVSPSVEHRVVRYVQRQQERHCNDRFKSGGIDLLDAYGTHRDPNTIWF